MFEYARQSLVEYLKRAFKGTVNDWTVIIDRFLDLAHSIGTIHGHGIVHR